MNFCNFESFPTSAHQLGYPTDILQKLSTVVSEPARIAGNMKLSRRLHQDLPCGSSHKTSLHLQQVRVLGNSSSVGAGHFPAQALFFFWTTEVREMDKCLGGGFNFFYVHPYLGKIPILTNIFQMGGSTTNQVFSWWFLEADQSLHSTRSSTPLQRADSRLRCHLETFRESSRFWSFDYWTYYCSNPKSKNWMIVSTLHFSL